MSTNLGTAVVASNQAQKEVTINDATGRLDAAITEVLVLDFTAADITLTNQQFQSHCVFRCTNVGTSRNLTVPAIKRGLFFVDNGAGAAGVTVVRGTSSFLVAPGQRRLYLADGTANGLFEAGGGSGGGGGGFQIMAWVPGKPTDNALVLRLVFGMTVSFGADMGDSLAVCAVDADSNAVFDIRKNGLSVGSLTFAATSMTGTFSVAGGVTFDAGDTIEIIAPTPQDADLETVSITLIGE